jgi:hypothetical protein
VFAAHQVIQDLMRRQHRTAQLAFDLSGFKPESRREIMKKLTEAGFFMKHADRGNRLDSISFDTDLTGVFIVYTMSGLRYFQQDVSAEEQAFNLWHILHKPELAPEVGHSAFENLFGIEAVSWARALPKDEFFKEARNFFRKGPAASQW